MLNIWGVIAKSRWYSPIMHAFLFRHKIDIYSNIVNITLTMLLWIVLLEIIGHFKQAAFLPFIISAKVCTEADMLQCLCKTYICGLCWLKGCLKVLQLPLLFWQLACWRSISSLIKCPRVTLWLHDSLQISLWKKHPDADRQQTWAASGSKRLLWKNNASKGHNKQASKPYFFSIEFSTCCNNKAF